MRNRFDRQLSTLNDELIEMGSMIEKSIETAIKALVNQDVDLARHAIEADEEIDRQERIIEDLCLKLLLQQQPVAKDLRLISSALKMITDMERIGDDPAAVEYDLGGADHVEASVSVDRTERPECLHHRLLTCLRVIDMVDHNIALPQYFLDISLSRFVMGAQISLIVRPDRNKTLPVVLRMHQDPVVLRLPEIKERFQDLVLDFNEL